ncbi:MAG: YhfC family intramembrane metalloprotease, partial [Clostridiales bacterium]|nr:YhfC family intramembrane metalloprotease [Clostridiales bacterium]
AYPYIYVMLLALSAALFESAGRLVVLKWALGKRLSYNTGIISGAGHGGIESILLVGATYAGNLYLSYIINTGELASVITDPTMAESIRSTLAETSSVMYLSAGFERLFTMVFHIALSVLFTYFIMKKRTALGFVTVASIHFLIDFIAVAMMINKIDVLLIESVIFIVALLSFIFIMKIKPRFGEVLSE